MKTNRATGDGKRGLRWGLLLAGAWMLPGLDASAALQAQVNLGTAENFAVLAGPSISVTSGGTINGDVGVSPGNTFSPGGVTINGTLHLADAVALQAQNDLTTAYNDAAGRLLPTLVAGELGGLTLVPGLYKDDGAPASLGLTGTLILDGEGDPEAVWIFQSASTLIAESGSRVLLINGAQACHVFWQVGSAATLKTGVSFKGNIMAAAAITMQTLATLDGRVLAANLGGTGAGVTLDNNFVGIPDCGNGFTQDAHFWLCFPGAWPTNQLTVGFLPLNQSSALEILELGLCEELLNTDAGIFLAAQLIAAKLNIFDGADPSAITGELAQADAFLLLHPPGSNPLGADQVPALALTATLQMFNDGTLGPGPAPSRVVNDFDRDFVTDVAVYHSATGHWYILQSGSASLRLQPFGWSETQPVPADYDGDDKTDVAVYQRGNGTWYILRSSVLNVHFVDWGWNGAYAAPGDYDGDGFDDIAVYDPAAANWYIRPSSNKTTTVVYNWGFGGVIPVPADYDGDGRTDIAVYHPPTGRWYIRRSSDSQLQQQAWGWVDAQPVPGDYDGDLKADIAVYAKTLARWYILRSSDGQMVILDWGTTDAQPVPGDYDGDQLTDLAVYRPSDGRWTIRQSSDLQLRQLGWGWPAAEPVLPQYQINRQLGTLQYGW